MLTKNPPRTKRSFEQIERHYRVERELAQRLKCSDRSERPSIYATMYQQLFAEVPDHPRLIKREDPKALEKRVRRCIRLLADLIRPEATFLEFGPGDCRLSMELSRRVREVYAVDIADQANASERPANFHFIAYDGYQLSLPEGSIDVVLSDQLIEHIHPDDIPLHFEIAYRLLKRGGAYALTTPHHFTGPHDVSRYFSAEPEGFHLKEWTYRELLDVIRNTGFSSCKIYRLIKNEPLRMPLSLVLRLEAYASGLPQQKKRNLSRLFLPHIAMIIKK